MLHQAMASVQLLCAETEGLSPGVGLNCGVLLLNSTRRTLENLRQDGRSGCWPANVLNAMCQMNVHTW